LRRREFITLLGGAAAWPLAARAQQPATPVVGVLSVAPFETNVQGMAAFREGLRATGYVEGQNVLVEYRSAESQIDRLPALAAELVRRPVAVILATNGDFALRAARAATGTVPIVFVTAGDPVETGFVPSLNRPGANITGVTFLSHALAAKRLEMLRELVPTATEIGLLENPANRNTEPDTRDVLAAARSLGRQIHVVDAVNESDFDIAFTQFTQQQVRACQLRCILLEPKGTAGYARVALFDPSDVC
jgi:putative ABC transport system substrate-binding protein